MGAAWPTSRCDRVPWLAQLVTVAVSLPSLPFSLLTLVPSLPPRFPPSLGVSLPNTERGSFGVLIHEVLTQRVPFAGKSVAKVCHLYNLRNRNHGVGWEV